MQQDLQVQNVQVEEEVVVVEDEDEVQILEDGGHEDPNWYVVLAQPNLEQLYADLDPEIVEWNMEKKNASIQTRKLARMFAEAKKGKARAVQSREAECSILGNALEKNVGFLLNDTKDPVGAEYITLCIKRIRSGIQSGNLETLRTALTLLQDPITRLPIVKIERVRVKK